MTHVLETGGGFGCVQLFLRDLICRHASHWILALIPPKLTLDVPAELHQFEIPFSLTSYPSSIYSRKCLDRSTIPPSSLPMGLFPLCCSACTLLLLYSLSCRQQVGSYKTVRLRKTMLRSSIQGEESWLQSVLCNWRQSLPERGPR